MSLFEKWEFKLQTSLGPFTVQSQTLSENRQKCWTSGALVQGFQLVLKELFAEMSQTFREPEKYTWPVGILACNTNMPVSIRRTLMEHALSRDWARYDGLLFFSRFQFTVP